MGKRQRKIFDGFRLPRPLRTAELLGVALIMALMTLFIGDLPELEVVESTVNDDSFSDLVVTTRGELPIDTSIIVVTYDESILDEEQRVDRALLADGLGIICYFNPAVVGVDFLVDDERPAYSEGDQMLAGVIADNSDKLLFGLYSIDSLQRALPPPPLFSLSEDQLGSVNLLPGEDNVVRAFTRAWPGIDGKPIEHLSLKIAERIDPKAANYIRSFDNESFVIDYAAGIGEHASSGPDGGQHVFPSIPLTSIAEALYSESTEDDAVVQELLEGKAVLVGYADLRLSQVTSVIDRFYTPLRQEKNTLPDMYGVTIHANILNTILQRRVVTEVPAWVNVLWGTFIVFLMYVGYEALSRIRPERKRSILRITGWFLLLVLALILPIFLFRYTPYKLSVYTPFAGLILGKIALTVFDRVKRFTIDIAHSRALSRSLQAGERERFRTVINENDPAERYVELLHLVQRLFHTAADVLFSEAATREFAFSRETVGSPTPRRILDDLESIDPLEFSDLGREAISFITRLWESFPLQRGLRAARSLVIAVNEIDRQTMMLEEEERAEGRVDPDLQEVSSFRRNDRDTVMMAAGGESAPSDAFEASDRLLREMLTVIVDSGAGAWLGDPEVGTEEPFVHSARCTLHEETESFVYLSEQEDANNQDDFFDLIYAGETMRCRPENHPGLTKFREASEGTVRRSTSPRDTE